MKKRILYAEANYQAIVRRNGYLVDKTAYIENLEQIDNPVFLRPRRFGKSLLCMMLESYYSVLFKDQFDQLFGQTWNRPKSDAASQYLFRTASGFFYGGNRRDSGDGGKL